MALLATAWKFLKKVRDFIVEYWQAFVALVLVAIGYLLGTRGNTSKIDKSDKAALEKHTDRMLAGQKDLYEKRIEEIEKATSDYEEEVIKVKEKTEEEIKQLSNDPEKLDNILKEKYNLEKGE